jgi:uncharacterized protein YjiS (DUF1127 family)
MAVIAYLLHNQATPRWRRLARAAHALLRRRGDGNASRELDDRMLRDIGIDRGVLDAAELGFLNAQRDARAVLAGGG